MTCEQEWLRKLEGRWARSAGPAQIPFPVAVACSDRRDYSGFDTEPTGEDREHQIRRAAHHFSCNNRLCLEQPYQSAAISK